QNVERKRAYARHRDQQRQQPPWGAACLAFSPIPWRWLEQRIGPAASALSERTGYRREPAARLVVEQGRQGVEHAGMIGIEPGGFLERQHFARDQPPVDGGECERLESVEGFLRAGDGCGANHQYQVLNADATPAPFVVA